MLAVALLACLCPAVARAQGGRGGGEAFSQAAARQVIDSMAALLRARYAVADTGALIAAHIERSLADGMYAKVTDWGQFVRLATQDVQSVNQDTHLLFQLAAGAGGPGGPGGAPAPDHGVAVVERLDGNIGYLRMTNFLGGQEAFDAIQGALTILSVADAIIIDLRNSRGGSPAVANFLISHFTGPDTTLSLLVYDRVRNTTTPRYTLHQVPGPRRPDVPLFILTDDVTRSAAEDATFVLQNLHRATVVGDTTAGAGRNVAGFPLGHGVIGAVSFTRVMEPGTRREWERVGVIPDIPTSRDSALAVAHREALRRVMAAARDDATRHELQQTLEGVEARYAALTRSAGQLKPAPELSEYVGTYEGDQTVEIVHASLVYQPRVAQPREVLSPLGNGLFASGSERYRFTVTGGSATLAVLGPDGSWSSFARVSRTVAPRRR